MGSRSVYSEQLATHIALCERVVSLGSGTFVAYLPRSAKASTPGGVEEQRRSVVLRRGREKGPLRLQGEAWVYVGGMDGGSKQTEEGKKCRRSGQLSDTKGGSTIGFSHIEATHLVCGSRLDIVSTSNNLGTGFKNKASRR